MTGFTRPPERCEGGLSDVWLVSAADVVECGYDPASEVFRTVTLRAGAAFVRYEFAEDTGRYRQYVSGRGPAACVVHELSFVLRRADSRCAAALDALLGASGAGFVALAGTAAGGLFVAGWSPGFGGECPLRLVSAEFDTQTGYDEDSGATLVLRSADADFSKPFAGPSPGRDE